MLPLNWFDTNSRPIVKTRWLEHHCHLSKVFPLFRIATKEIIFKAFRILTCFLALVTIHIMAAMGDPDSTFCTFSKWIYKLLLQFYTLPYRFWSVVSCFPLLPLTGCFILVLFDIFFSFKVPKWKAKMSLSFSEVPIQAVLLFRWKCYIYLWNLLRLFIKIFWLLFLPNCNCIFRSLL